MSVPHLDNSSHGRHQRRWGQDHDRHTGKVVSPKRSDLILPTNIPHIELRVLIRDSLDVEAYCRDRCDILIKLELVEDRCDAHVSILRTNEPQRIARL